MSDRPAASVRTPRHKTALSRFFAGRCSCDAHRLGSGWLPGFCPHPECINWDWRFPSGDPIDRPLSCAEVGDVLGVSRQRINQIEAIAIGKFIRRMRGKSAHWSTELAKGTR